MHHQEVRQRSNKPFGKPRQFIDDSPKLSGPIAGDIIKPPVVEAPTIDRVWELLYKRYRVKESGMENTMLLESIVESSLDKPSTKDAVEFVVSQLVQAVEHDRFVILTGAEMVVKKRKDNINGIMRAMVEAIKKTGVKRDIQIAFNRQASMRKIDMPTWAFDNVMERMRLQGFVATFAEKYGPDKNLTKHTIRLLDNPAFKEDAYANLFEGFQF